jgi:AcrR family transcriptional regulator
MKSTAQLADERRPYRQTARAAAAEATAARIIGAFRARLERLWFEEIRLEDVAQEAGVTVQTVIRRFGGKEGLLDAASVAMDREIMAIRARPVGDPDRVVRAIVDDYEVMGDIILRLLAQEDRHPALRRITDLGRTEHRRWVETVFAPQLDGLGADAARRRTDALVVATDLFTWRLVRRDMGRPRSEVEAIMRRLVRAALSDATSAGD